MPSLLIDELVRRGLLDPDQVTSVTRHQAELGGGLDTALLELGLADEATLASALAEAYGTVPFTAELASAPVDPQATRAFPEQWAKKYRLAPVALERGQSQLQVLAAPPLDRGLLGRLGALLELSLSPVVAPEIRVMQRLAALYGDPLPPRVELLLDRRPGSGRPRAPAPLPPMPPPPDERSTAWLQDALGRLREARGRDEIIHQALTQARREFEFAALFVVHDRRLAGWSGLGTGAEHITQVTIEPDARSAFWTAMRTQAYFLGPLPKDDLALLGPLGRPPPRAGLIIPLRVQERPLGILYADNGGRAISPRAASDLMLYASYVRQAIEDLVLRRKSTLPTTAAELSIPPVPSWAPSASASLTPAREVPLAAAPVEPPAPAPEPVAERPPETAPEWNEPSVPSTTGPAWAAEVTAALQQRTGSGVSAPEAAPVESAPAKTSDGPAWDSAPPRFPPPSRLDSSPRLPELEAAAEPEASAADEPSRNAAALRAWEVSEDLPSAPPDAESSAEPSAEPSAESMWEEVSDFEQPIDREDREAQATPEAPAEAAPPAAAPAPEAAEAAPDPRVLGAALDAANRASLPPPDPETDAVLADLAEIDEAPPEPAAAAPRPEPAPAAAPEPLPEPAPAPVAEAAPEPVPQPPAPVEEPVVATEALDAPIEDTERSPAIRVQPKIEGRGTNGHPLTRRRAFTGPLFQTQEGETRIPDPLPEPEEESIEEDVPLGDLEASQPGEPDVPIEEAEPEWANLAERAISALEAEAQGALGSADDALAPVIPPPLLAPEPEAAPPEPPSAKVLAEAETEPLPVPPLATESQRPVSRRPSLPPRAVTQDPRAWESKVEASWGEWSSRPAEAPPPSRSPAPSVPPPRAPSVPPPRAPSMTPGQAPSLTPAQAPSMTPAQAPSLTPGRAPSVPPPAIDLNDMPELSRDAWVRASSRITRAEAIPEPEALPVPLAVPRHETPVARGEPINYHPQALSSSGRIVDRNAEPSVPPPPAAAPEPPVEAAPLDLEALLDQLEGPSPEARAFARAELAAHSREALPLIMQRFPGRVGVDPFGASETLPPFAQCGDLLALLARVGPEAHPFVLERLDDPLPALRFFALYFYSAVPVPEAIPRITRRLHDEEPRVAMLAVSVLLGYRDHPGFKQVLTHLHSRLSSPSPNARRHAARLLAMFRDGTAVPLLVAVFERKERGFFDAAEEALAEITKQRFGSNTRKWTSWWESHRRQSRVVWLLEGLDSSDADLRKSSAEELRVLSGLDLGYDENGPKKAREEAKKRWQAWWAIESAHHAESSRTNA